MKTYFHIIEESSNENIGYQGLANSLKEGEKACNDLQEMFPNSFFYVYEDTSKKEPVFITV